MADFKLPDQAKDAATAAVSCAETNGFSKPTIVDAELAQGVWKFVISSKAGSIAIIRVSNDNTILSYSGPR